MNQSVARRYSSPVLVAALLALLAVQAVSPAGSGYAVAQRTAPSPVGSPPSPQAVNASIAHGYYGWQGDKERLELVPGKAGVTFSAPPSAKALADTAGASSDLYLDPATPSKALDAGSRHGARTFVYEFAHPLVKADHGETLRTLREQPGVLAANPVFKSSSGRESLLTDYIYVSFPIDTPEERIFELFAEDGLEIVRDETYERIGERGFRLRLGPSALAKADPTRGAMDLANRYHDNPLTSGATPMFSIKSSSTNACAITPMLPVIVVGSARISSDAMAT